MSQFYDNMLVCSKRAKPSGQYYFLIDNLTSYKDEKRITFVMPGLRLLGRINESIGMQTIVDLIDIGTEDTRPKTGEIKEDDVLLALLIAGADIQEMPL